MLTDDRSWLATTLNGFIPSADYHEQADRLHMLELLRNHPRCFWRDCFQPGHVTGSAWLLNPARSRVLLVLHPTLQKWYQLGGHADGDGHLYQVALREASEETGLPEAAFQSLNGGTIFDLDIHPIPANAKKSEPEHLHYDVRFVFTVDDTLPLPNPEGLTLKWLSLADAAAHTTAGNSIHRMLAKTIALR